jgi:hypothetical protein
MHRSPELMAQDSWSIEIEGLPSFEMAMNRIAAWYENEIIDRPPVRFIAHNAFLETAKQDISNYSRQEKETWWFDVERQVDLFIRSIAGRKQSASKLQSFSSFSVVQ